MCSAQLRHVARKLVGARRRFAAPEGNGRRRAVRIFHQHPSGIALHPPNQPRSVAQQHDVAGVALHREVLIQRADHYFFRLRHHREQRRLRNRSAAGDGRQPRAAPRPQPPVHHVAEQIRAVAAALGGDALRQHLQHAIKLLPRKFAIGICPPRAGEQLIFVPVFAGAHGHHLLRHNVQRRRRNLQPVEIALANGAHRGGAFQQFVARSGEQPPLGHRAAPVTGAANALQRHRDGARRIDLAHQVHGADINAQFQRRGRHQQPNLAILQLALCRQPQLARQAAMMRRHLIFAQPLAQMQRHPLRQPPRVHKHQRGTMRERQLRQAVVNLAPHFVAGDRPQLRRRNFHREIQLAAMPDVHDRGRGTVRTGEEARDLFNRLLRRRQSDARGRRRQQVQPLQRQRQVRAALVVGDGVDFVHDHRLDVPQDGAAAVGGEQDVQRFRRGHQDVRRPLDHLAPLLHQSVAGADGGADLRHQQAALARQRQDFAQRAVEILLDVVAQRLQRRDVEHFGRVAQRAVERLAHQPVNADEERRQRLAGTGRRGDQRSAAGQNFRPALLLRLGGRAKARQEPLGDQRMRPR